MHGNRLKHKSFRLPGLSNLALHAMLATLAMLPAACSLACLDPGNGEITALHISKIIVNSSWQLDRAATSRMPDGQPEIVSQNQHGATISLYEWTARAYFGDDGSCGLQLAGDHGGYECSWNIVNDRIMLRFDPGYTDGKFIQGEVYRSGRHLKIPAPKPGGRYLYYQRMN